MKQKEEFREQVGEIRIDGSWKQVSLTVIHKQPAHEIFKKLQLEENTVYKVIVKTCSSNVEHFAILHAGFSSGAYCEVWNHSYDNAVSLDRCYAICVLANLCRLKE